MSGTLWLRNWLHEGCQRTGKGLSSEEVLVTCQRFVDRLGSAVLENECCDWYWHSNLVIVVMGTLVARCNSGVTRG